jgi:hypothetical protein
MPFSKLALVALAALSITGCAQGDEAAQRQTKATLASTNEADRKIGMPALHNFYEKQLARDVYERRDQAISTYAYLQGMDGSLKCLGKAVGYGIPYATQYTAPQALRYLRPVDADGTLGAAAVELVDQPEPNGLYMPNSASATWIQIVDPATGKLDVMYVEPNLIVSPHRLTGPIVSSDCANAPAPAKGASQ